MTNELNQMKMKMRFWLGFCLAAFLTPAAQAACSYSLSPASRSHGYGAATNFITVNAGTNCPWTVTSTPAWITIQSGASGTSTGSVTYVVAANADSIGRTGLVVIADQSFTVQQAGVPCSYNIVPATRNHGAGGTGAANPLEVYATTNCAWSVINTSLWINLTGTTNGVGYGTIPYGVLANNTPVRRTGNVLIADQVFVLSQNAGSCQYELQPTNRLHGYAGSTGLVTVSIIPANGGCAWFAINTNDWISITTQSAGTNSGGTFGYSVAPNPNSSPRTGIMTVWDQAFTVFQNATPCSNGYAILPTSASPGPEAETNTVQVTAVGGCPWSVINTNPWIQILSPTQGTNNGSVTWAVLANASAVGRTGVVTIAEKIFTVRQDAGSCSYKLSTTNRVHGYSAASNSVNLTVLSTCPWTMANTNPWITIYSPASGFGSATFPYTLTPNTSVNDRVGTLTIAGISLVITQHGLACAVSLSPTNRNHGHGVATNTVRITIADTCDWSASTTNPWVSLIGITNGIGSNTLTYAIEANPTAFPRIGTINVEEATITITQSNAPCTYSISPSSTTHGPAQTTGTVNIATMPGCDWTVDNTNTWITFLTTNGPTQVVNGTGSNTLTYQVSGNLDLNARSANITIAGRTFAVVQNGVTCNYKLSPTNRTHGYAATTNFLTMNVSNPCPWAVTTTNPWISILSETNGIGSNTVTYALGANNLSPFDRIGAIFVDGTFCVITQHGIPCAWTLVPTKVTHGYGATSNSFAVNANAGCPWTVGNTNPWVTITAGASGDGNGTVAYTLTENQALADRIALLTVDGQTFTITQRAATCAITLSPTNRNHGYAAATNTVDIDISPGCPWSTVTSNTWITILDPGPGTGPGTVTYAVSSNLDVNPRTGEIYIGNQGPSARTFSVNQGPFNCNYKISPTNRTHGFGANTNSANVTNVAPSCSWTANTTNDWIQIISGASASGNGTFTYTVAPNSGSTPRVGAITVADEVLTLTQSAASNGFAFEAIIIATTGDILLKLNGGPPGIWELQSSPDLATWTNFARITNITGRVEFTVPATAGTNRFYRAMLP